MAQGIETNLDDLPIGTDFSYPYHIYTSSAQTTSLDITGFALSWMLKRKLTDADAAASLTKTTANGGIAIAGAFNATPGSNLQRATVTVLDTNTDSLAPGIYHWELKRTDAGLETRLAYGRVELVRGVHRS